MRYATYTSSSGWVDQRVPYYTHDPALAINSQGDLYLIGHGLYPRRGCSRLYTPRQYLYPEKNSTGWDLPQLFATPPSNETFDASVSVRWSIAGWNRPVLIDLVFFSGKTSNYWDMSMYYGTLGSTGPDLTPTPGTATPTTTGVVTDCSNDTEFSALLAGGGTITFNCGSIGAVATIAVSSVKTITANITVDGGGKIPLNGSNARPNFYRQLQRNVVVEQSHPHQGNAVGGGLIRNDGALLSQHEHPHQ